MRSKPFLEHEVNSHAVYLTLGQHCILHKKWQHLHHNLFNGFYNQMHPVAWTRNLGVPLQATLWSSSPTTRELRKKETEELIS